MASPKQKNWIIQVILPTNKPTISINQKGQDLMALFMHEAMCEGCDHEHIVFHSMNKKVDINLSRYKQSLMPNVSHKI